MDLVWAVVMIWAVSVEVMHISVLGLSKPEYICQPKTGYFSISKEFRTRFSLRNGNESTCLQGEVVVFLLCQLEVRRACSLLALESRQE